MYEILSDYYDALIDKEYYSHWIDHVDSLLGDRHRGADVGCGSGIFTVELSRRGRDIIGIDPSEEMLRRAFERALNAGVKPKFANGRAEKLELPFKADFVIAMNDVVNYMKDPLPFFRAAARNLTDGGLLLFDISSEYKLKNILAGRAFSLEAENVVCVWENSGVCGDSLQMHLKFFEREADGRYRLKEETQEQYVHTEEKIKAMLEECGFDVKIYANLTKNKPDGKSARLHFAAEKGRNHGKRNT